MDPGGGASAVACWTAHSNKANKDITVLQQQGSISATVLRAVW